MAHCSGLHPTILASRYLRDTSVPGPDVGIDPMSAHWAGEIHHSLPVNDKRDADVGEPFSETSPSVRRSSWTPDALPLSLRASGTGYHHQP